MTIAEQSIAVSRGAASPVDLVRSCLERIESRGDLNAFITVFADQAIADAEAAQSEIVRGKYRGPLHGIPISVKDLVHIAGVPTTSGSAVPAIHPTEDAPVVRRLREAGAVIIGKTNLHEFAFGTTSDESAFGPIRNPFDTSRSAGGSSGGAAVALVEGMCLGSIGTDTGGSIRIPSAACGVVGLKPTYGELSCDGVVPLSTTCDHIGPMAQTVDDVRLMFAALAGRDVNAPESSRPLKFGVPRGYLLERLDGDVRTALGRVRDRLTGEGHTVADVEIAMDRSTPDVYLHIVLSEAAVWHAPLLDRHPDKYSPGVRHRLEMGRYVLAEDYVRAMTLRERLRKSVEDALKGYDALLLPTLPIPAPVLGDQSVMIDGTPEPVRAAMLRLTQLFNLTGHPAISLPAGLSSGGLPIGIQLVGRHGETDRLLAVAAAVESQITDGPGSVGGGTG
jgi:aspartyl-tRNA(Asn)/glutamyl-tRNA(Gln) amidotransferase subunit A